VAATISTLSQKEISAFEKNKQFVFHIDAQQVTVLLEDVEIISEDIPGWLVANEGKLTVALEITITEALHREGIARELVNRIQNLRKSSGFEITDKIKIVISKNETSDAAISEYNAYICKQVLGTSLTLTDQMENGMELEFDDYSLFANITKDN